MEVDPFVSQLSFGMRYAICPNREDVLQDQASWSEVGPASGSLPWFAGHPPLLCHALQCSANRIGFGLRVHVHDLTVDLLNGFWGAQGQFEP